MQDLAYMSTIEILGMHLVSQDTKYSRTGVVTQCRGHTGYVLGIPGYYKVTSTKSYASRAKIINFWVGRSK